jgi:hypothetical protein
LPWTNALAYFGASVLTKKRELFNIDFRKFHNLAKKVDDEWNAYWEQEQIL